ncbi:redoxin family protein [Aegicerativicinus sediminis]|uniref:redoxin family protein n=1 Tax=Aegicerativicinus sediminis TaxID=2893202 RepID=UPI001E640AE2|nr:redoxin family protein [Aegicerativicinus sediminis]
MAITVDDIGLYDQNDDFHNLYYYDDANAIVLYVQGNGCPMVRNGFRTYETISNEFKDKGVQFFMVNSNLQDDRDEIGQEADEYGMSLPILIDNHQFLAENLNLTRTAETIVIDPSDWSLVYRGPIDDQLGYEGQKIEPENDYLRNALNSFLNGEKVQEPYVRSKGCAIKRGLPQEAKEDLTFIDDIAPILETKCTQCHVENGIGSWAMTDYYTVYGWSEMIREVILNKRMPPWQADPKYGHFKEDLSLTEQEVRNIVGWIDNGMPLGIGNNPLAKIKPFQPEWKFGEPDTIFELTERHLPATGLIDYMYQEFPMDDLPEDMKVRAVEVVPGNPEVLHHILATIRYPDGTESPVERKRGPWLDGIFIGWAPGGGPELFPENSVRTIPKGSKLIIQSHYTANGKEAIDNSKIGLYFAKNESEKELVSLGPANFEFVLEPYKKNVEVEAVEEIKDDIKLYSLFPHMHFRGKSFKYVVEYPNGEEEVVLNVPNYNFNWQRNYYLENPIEIHGGSKLKLSAVFDNSGQNPFNPSPQDSVKWGEQTMDEMMIGYFNFVYDKKPKKILEELAASD